MNKYTLVFNQQHLEELYQLSRYQFRMNAFKKCTFLFMIMCLFRLIQYIIGQQLAGILLAASLMTVNLILYIIILKFYKNGMQLCIFSQNILLAVLQLFQNEYGNAFLFGTNLSIVHSLYFVVQQFKYSTLNMILTVGAQLIITSLQENILRVETIFLTILVPFCLMFALYEIEKGKRNLFLSHNNEKNWHNILPSIVTDPFILFTYDNESLHFSLNKVKGISQFPSYQEHLDNDKNFRTFLRQYKVEEETLEKFIISQINQHRKFFQCQQLDMEACSQSSKQRYVKITFVELYHLQNNFIIILEKNFEQINVMNNTKQQLITLINQHQALVIGFLQKQTQLILKAIEINKMDSSGMLIRVKLHHLYFLGKYRISNSLNKLLHIPAYLCFDFKALFQTILYEFALAYPESQNLIDFTASNYSIIADKEMIQDLIIQLLYVLIRKQDLIQSNKIILHSNNDYIFIRIITYNVEQLGLNLKRNMFIRQILSQNAPTMDITVNDNSIQIQLFKNTEQFSQLLKFE